MEGKERVQKVRKVRCGLQRLLHVYERLNHLGYGSELTCKAGLEGIPTEVGEKRK